jgi:L-cystine uptake protein TcyP (sodium:dicarboxylate symporter family)
MATKNNHFLNPNLYYALLISVVLLVVQYGAMLHAVEHPFHEHDASCNVYFAAERLGNGLVALVILPIIPLVKCSDIPSIIHLFYGQRIHYFFARAPPIFLLR